MSQTGSRGQGGPPKSPGTATGQAASPAPPQVAKPPPPAKPQPPRAAAPSKPGIVVQAPKAPRPVSAPAWNKDGQPFDDETTVVGPSAVPEARASASGSFSREEIRAIVRGAVDDAVMPLQHMLRDVEQRLNELEQRPRAASAPAFEGTIASTPAALAAQLHAGPPPLPPHGASPSPPAAAPSVPGPYASAIAPPAQSRMPVPAALAPRMSVADIEKNVKLTDADLALIDGRGRKRRNVILLVLFILVVFGGMFAMLAQSYMHRE